MPLVGELFREEVQSWQLPPGEDVLPHKGVVVPFATFGPAQRVQQKYAIVFEAVIDFVEVSGKGLTPYVLKHPHRVDAVELAFSFPIVSEAKVDVRMAVVFLGPLHLCFGQRHSCDLHIVLGRQKVRQTAKAKTDLQELHTRLQVQLFADHFHLGHLGLIQSEVWLVEVADGVLHVPVQHLLIDFDGFHVVGPVDVLRGSLHGVARHL
mmetsp:Transcript_25383/g.60419  ORF Transcript_25383/g.60419 Transcript_25383/m.60419 type:complete len:208 (+) Transcript_25383:436-1059(+)